MKEHQNVHQVINQAPTVLGLSLYRKATTPTHSPPHKQDGLARRSMTAAASLVGFTARTFHAPKARDGTQILSKKRTPPFDGRVKGG